MLLDVAALAETVGLPNWHDPQLWNMGKFSFSDEFIPLYADHVARTVAALRGKSRKALILDLDNTVWGGVIGDDGLEGIAIAQGDARAKRIWRCSGWRWILRQRGIVLAVSSKNTDEVAREPFEKHPEMLLKLDHIAVFQANWNDKATNIQAIAEELSLGLDAMVFLDDNPVERGLVRRLLPQVAVPELPEDPAYYARTLAAAGYFEAVAFAGEDLQARGLLPGQRQARQPAEAGWRRRRVSRLAGYDHHLPAVRRDGQSAHRAAHQQVEPVQPDHAPLHRSRSGRGGKRSRGLHAAGAAGGHLRRQRHDQRRHLPPRRTRCLGDRHLADELPRARAQGGAHGAARDSLSTRAPPASTNCSEHTGPRTATSWSSTTIAKLGFTRIAEEDNGLTRWEMTVEGAEPEAAPMKVVSDGFRLLRS